MSRQVSKTQSSANLARRRAVLAGGRNEVNADRRILTFENERQERAGHAMQNLSEQTLLPLRLVTRDYSRWCRINGHLRNTCVACGKEYMVLRSDDVHCSNACRQKAYRLRKKALRFVSTDTKCNTRAKAKAKARHNEATRNKIILEALKGQARP
jgi:hypothetical protein